MFTLGRKIDIHYPTNRWIVIIAILVTALSFFLTKEFSIAWKIGASIFLAWVVTREIDPKREYAAFVSVFLALSIFLVDFKVDLLVIFFLVLLLRFINNITGKPNTILDMLTLLGMAGFLSYNGKSSGYLLILLMALFLNSSNVKNKKMNTIFFIVTTAISFIQIFNLGGIRFVQVLISYNLSIVIPIAISVFGYFVFILIDKDKEIVGDNGEIVPAKRVLNGQIFYYIAVIFLFVFTKVEIGNMIVYLSSIWGYMIYGTFSMIKNKKSV